MKIPRFIIRAAPTCTLYRRDERSDFYQFRIWPFWIVTQQMIVEAGR